VKSGYGLCCPVTQVADIAAERWTPAASPRRDGCIASYSCAKGSHNKSASTGVNHRLSPLLSGESLQGVEIGRCENHQEFTRPDTPHGPRPEGFSGYACGTPLRSRLTALSEPTLLVPQPQHVERSVLIAVQTGPTLRALMPADGHALLHDHATA